MRLLSSPFQNGCLCGVTFLLLVSSSLAANGTKIDVGKIPNESQLGNGSYASKFESNYDSNDGPDEDLSGIMLGNNQPAGVNAKAILDDIASQKRTILLVAMFSDRFVMIVNSVSPTDKDDVYVFDQKTGVSEDDSLKLDSPKKLKRTKWSKLIEDKVGKMFAIQDSSEKYIIFQNVDSLHCALRMSNGNSINLSESLQSSLKMLAGVSSSTGFLSSSKPMTFYQFNGKDTAFYIRSTPFFGNKVSTANLEKVTKWKSWYFCKNAEGDIVAKLHVGSSSGGFECNPETNWKGNIQAGFEHGGNFYLFDNKGNVVKFPYSKLPTRNGTSSKVSFKNIIASSFWKEENPRSSSSTSPSTSHPLALSSVSPAILTTAMPSWIPILLSSLSAVLVLILLSVLIYMLVVCCREPEKGNQIETEASQILSACNSAGNDGDIKVLPSPIPEDKECMPGNDAKMQTETEKKQLPVAPPPAIQAKQKIISSIKNPSNPKGQPGKRLPSKQKIPKQVSAIKGGGNFRSNYSATGKSTISKV